MQHFPYHFFYWTETDISPPSNIPSKTANKQTPECWSNGALLGIVTEFQTVIPYTSCYWNRKKRLCCKSLRSNVLLAKNETPHKKPKCLLIKFNTLWVLLCVMVVELRCGDGYCTQNILQVMNCFDIALWVSLGWQKSRTRERKMLRERLKGWEKWTSKDGNNRS